MFREPSRIESLHGWGRMRPEECRVFRPERIRDVEDLLGTTGKATFIARGCGRSYGDAAQNGSGAVVRMTRFDRILEFDSELGKVRCEGGVTVKDLLDTFLPRGWFPAVVPGTKYVTVGGAIACDVHGKNHHRDGSFSNFLEEVTVLPPGGGTIKASREQNPEVFWATVGGMGLTGIILEARLRLRRVRSGLVRVDYSRTSDLGSTLNALAEIDPKAQYTVAWLDTMSTGKSLGRGVVMAGEHAEAGRDRDSSFELRRARHPVALTVPPLIPGSALSPQAIAIFNSAYWRLHATRHDVVAPADRFFFPLDRLGKWNRLYGRRGFAQFQCVVPPGGSEDGIRRILEILHRNRQPSFLAVLKRFGQTGGGFLSFPMPGWTLALDLPATTQLPDVGRRIHEIVLDLGGRVYLAKDSLASPDQIALMYARLPEFRAVQWRLDSSGVLSSTLERRLNLLGRR